MIISSVSPSFQQFIFTLTDPTSMGNTLKTQLDSTKANAGPFILRSQFFKEKYTGSTTRPISVYFARLQQFQTRLSTTPCSISDNDLISHVLSFGTLPNQFEATLEFLRIQYPTITWSTLSQTLINKEIQFGFQDTTSTSISTTVSTDSINPTTILANSSKSKTSRNKNRNRNNSKKPRNDSGSDEEDYSHSQRSKDSSTVLRCFYCCKKGHKASECILKGRPKVCNRNSGSPRILRILERLNLILQQI
jgi:hypothetical protein